MFEAPFFPVLINNLSSYRKGCLCDLSHRSVHVGLSLLGYDDM